ncbi:DUF6531 domain-containing protein [Streptomyces parvus]|uniref:DUF6531 domain-containing protein n=1 Tax=Streptomyces parvus TaxID=66428 RepID=UPI003442A9F7
MIVRWHPPDSTPSAVPRWRARARSGSPPSATRTGLAPPASTTSRSTSAPRKEAGGRPTPPSCPPNPRRTNAFGIGWATRWDMRLVQESAAGTVLVTHADGSQARFGRNPDGTLAGPSGSTTDLVADSSGRLLRQRTGTTLRFDSTGLLRLGQRQPSGRVLA